MKKIDLLDKMTPYEKCKLIIDAARLIAMLAAPFAAVILNHWAEVYLGW